MKQSTTKTTAQVLLVDECAGQAGSLSVDLGRGTYNIVRADSMEQALTIVEQSQIDVVALTLSNPRTDGADLVRRIRYLSPFTEVIVVAPAEGEMEMTKIDEAGAFDSLVGPLSPERMLSRIQKAVEHSLIKAERGLLREHVAMRYGFDNIVGVSKAVTEIKETIARVAPTDIPVLITGASGTGKELTARVIHHHSLRRDSRLILVDCSARSQSVMSDQLFDHEGPTGDSLLERADGGTLVLDNIEALSQPMQNRLLAFVKDFTVVDAKGSTRRLDIRFISLANVQAETTPDSSDFDQTLRDHLSPITIELPSLMDRADDIEILVDHFLRTIAAETGEPTKAITRTAVDRLLHHGWPGNIRELENTVRRAAVLCSRDTLAAEDISFVGSSSGIAQATATEPVERTPISRLDENQRTLIERALVENGWNYTQTAQELGIGRTTLWRKVKKFNLKRDGETVSSFGQ